MQHARHKSQPRGNSNINNNNNNNTQYYSHG